MAKQKPLVKMDPVTEFIFSSMTIDKDVLRYLLSLLDPETSSRMVYALAGIFNPIKMMETIPQKSRPHSNTSYCDYSDCVYDHYDYLRDRVYFTYTRTSYRIFKNPVDAEKYTKTGDYDWHNGVSKEGKVVTEEQPYLGAYTCESNSDTSYDNWMNNAIVEE